jgi:hypothetical protein
MPPIKQVKILSEDFKFPYYPFKMNREKLEDLMIIMKYTDYKYSLDEVIKVYDEKNGDILFTVMHFIP